MTKLRDAIIDGAGFCSAVELNANTQTVYRYKNGRYVGEWTTRQPDEWNELCGQWGNNYNCYEAKEVIRNSLPSRCLNYHNNELTYFDTLRYEGDPYNGGRWVE